MFFTSVIIEIDPTEINDGVGTHLIARPFQIDYFERQCLCRAQVSERKPIVVDLIEKWRFVNKRIPDRIEGASANALNIANRCEVQII